MRILSILAIAVFSAALTSCEGFNPADAMRIGAKGYDLYKDVKDTAAKAKADAKAVKDVQSAFILQPLAYPVDCMQSAPLALQPQRWSLHFPMWRICQAQTHYTGQPLIDMRV